MQLETQSIMNRYHLLLHHFPLFVGANLFLFLLLLLFALPILSGAFYIDHNISPRREEWSYSKQMDWIHYFPVCGEQSKRQSPINIKRENVITNSQLTLKFFNYNRRIKFTIQNAHHTIKMNPIPDKQSSEFGSQQPPFDINTVDEPEPSSSYLDAADGSDGTLHQQHNTIDRNQDQDQHSNIYTSSSSNAEQDTQQHVLNKQQPMHNKRSSLLNSTASTTFDQKTDQLHLQQPGMNTNEQHLKQAIIVNQSLDVHSSGDGVDSINNNKQTTRLPYDGLPMIRLDWMDDHNNEYRLHDIHFHWGTNKDNGSEHLIDGRKSAMEMHLVHIKRGLKKDQIGYNSDSVVVIAVLIESYRKSNANLNPIVNTLTSINMSDVSQVIDYGAINDLLPNDRTKFYTYSGSLTTPPCFEVVNWIVMHERVYINAKQMEMFRNIYAKMEHGGGNNEHQLQSEVVFKIMPNIRHRQSSRGRPIMASFVLNNMINESDNELTSGATKLTLRNTSSMVVFLASIILTTSVYLMMQHSRQNVSR